MIVMRILPSLAGLALVLCGFPLAGQGQARHIVAACNSVTASMGPSAEDSPEQGRGFGIHIENSSTLPLLLPTYPEFGWRVETLRGNSWKLKAEGGPLRRVGSPDDPKLAIVGATGSGPMVEVAPGFARMYRFHLPEADQALRHEGRLTTLRLSVYWAPSPQMQQATPPATPCAVTADWTLRIRP
jgi:hypothetical protein